VPPYITTNPALVGAGVLLAGSLIRVPAPTSVWADDEDRGQVYGRDCAMIDRKLSDDGAGDLLVVTGADNLRQQLQHAVSTPRGQARRHPQYGCMVWRLLGTVNGPTAARLGAEYVKETLLADFRVASVDRAAADVSGDAVRITARAVAIEGGVVDVSINQD
jgi:phage baseplate assembly protein W